MQDINKNEILEKLDKAQNKAEIIEGVEALAERKDLEEWAFYESGLVAHDEYMCEAITRYGRLLLSKQRKEIIDLQAELEYYRGVPEQVANVREA